MTSTPSAPNWPATVQTPRLELRPAGPEDFEVYLRLWSEPEVRRFLGGPVAEQYVPVYQNGLIKRPYNFSVVVKETSTVVGTVFITPTSRFDERREVSYSFLPEHWGHGYAREAVAAVVEWALEAVPSEDPTIIAVTQEANTRSRALLESIGMVKIDGFVEFDEPQTMYSIATDGPPDPA